MKTRIVTHDGSFHADEIFATALIKKFVSEDVEIVRTRGDDDLKEATKDPNVWVVDVGRKHDESMRNFDHHQRSFTKTWEGTDIPFSSCGLVWKYLRDRGIIGSHYADEVIDSVEAALIRRVDMHDNRYAPMPQAVVFKLCNREESTMDDFLRALMIAEIHLEDSFIFAEKVRRNQCKLDNVKFLANGDIAVFDEEVATALSWVRKSTAAKVVVMPKEGVDTWSVRSVAGEDEGILTPFWWRGLAKEELRRVSGIKDLTFVHKAGYLAVVESKDSAVKIARVMLGD